jgi:broad specificity phosphatase PhoE
MGMWLLNIKGESMRIFFVLCLFLLTYATGQAVVFERDIELVSAFKANNLKIIVLCNFQGSNNVQDIVTASRSPGYELTNLGISMLQDTLPGLRKEHISHIYTAPSFRAQQATNLLGKGLNLLPNQLSVDSRLGMQNFGSADGEDYDDYKARFAGLEDMLENTPPNGESGYSVFTRTDDFLNSLSSLENQTVLVVTHAFNFCHITKIITGKYGTVPAPGTYVIYDFHN